MARLIHPATILDAATVTLGDLFKGTTFRIPDYQRDFTWGEDELTTLLDDIDDTLERAFPNHKLIGNPDGHFLGAIVTHRPPGSMQSEVIDGQQRLTTFSIIISVLLEFVEGLADIDRRTNLVTQLLPLIADSHGGGREPKLRLARDHEFYNQSVVQRLTMEDRLGYWQGINLDKEPVKQRIRNAVVFVHKHLSKVIDAAHEPEFVIANIAEVVTELMLILRLEVIDHRLAYRVFETLNFRGLALSQADLLKNELIHQAGLQGTRQLVADNWSALNANLDRVTNLSLVEFLQFHYASKYAPVRASELFESVVKHLERSSLTPASYTNDVVSESARLVQLVEGDASAWGADANQALDDIRDIFGLKFAYPLLMAAAARYVNSAEDFNKWAVRVRNFCFRYSLIQRNPLSSFEKVVTDAARSLRDDSVPDQDVLVKLKDASPDEVFAERFATATVATNKLGFYIIKSIEDHIAGGAGVTLPQGPAQHLEHIMPKKPGAGWGHISGDARYADYLPRIGNLLGLERKINIHIKNCAFSYKEANAAELDYQHSKLNLPSRAHDFLNTSGDWDFSSIEERQKFLAVNYSVKVWPLD